MIVIIGAGLAGLTAGRALLNAGCRDFLICERDAQVGDYQFALGTKNMSQMR